MSRYLKQTAFVLISIFIIWLGLWALVQTPALPNPVAVAKNILLSLPNGLAIHTLYSFLRLLGATALAVVCGVPLGLILGYFPGWNKALMPFIYFSYPVPKLALLPIILVLCGLGEGPKLLIIFLVIFFPVVLDIAAAVKTVDTSLIDALRGFGLKPLQIVTRVILPGLAAPILTCLKITTGMGLSVLFLAENYGTSFGLGYYIMNAWQKMDYVELYTGVTVLALLGFILFLCLDAAERKVTRWK